MFYVYFDFYHLYRYLTPIEPSWYPADIDSIQLQLTALLLTISAFPSAEVWAGERSFHASVRIKL